MKNSWTLAPLLLAGSLYAQSTDWRSLESLPEGTQLILKTWHNLPCTLSSIDNAGIECALLFNIVRIDRLRIAAVSLSRPEHITALSALVGAAAGAGLAVAQNNDGGKPIAAMAGALVGGLVGSLVGHIIGSNHGPKLYVRP